MIKTLLQAALCVLFASFASAAMEPQNVVVCDFTDKTSAAGWSKTKSLVLEPQDDCLKLLGHGWDSKIYRAVDLAPGYYLLSATGKGQSLRIRVTEELSSGKFLFDMNLAREGAWRNDWRPFQIKTAGRYWLVIQVLDGREAVAFMKQLKIDRAEAPPTDGAKPEELAKSRPVPEIVRGCTCPGGANLADLRTWGANVARKFIRLKPSRYVDGFAEYDPGWESAQLATVESYLQDARRCGMKVVLTLDGGAFHQDSRHNAFWSSPKLAPGIAAVWRGIAQRLLPYRDVLYGYDLYNEPLDWEQMPHPPRQWRGAAAETVKAIREVDKEVWIVYEPGPGGMYSGMAELVPLKDARVLYSVHFYAPYEFTHQGVYNLQGTDLAEAKTKLNVHYPGEINGFLWNKESLAESLSCVREFQQRWQVPILVGEFSVIRWAPKPDAETYLKDLIDLFEAYHWSWIYHGFREWPGWSLEHNEDFARHEGPHLKADVETERAKVVKAGLIKNGSR